MNCFKHPTILLLYFTVLFSVNSYAVSIADVYQQVRFTEQNIFLLKSHYAPDKNIRVPGIQVGKTAMHAYIKGLELLEKIQKYQIQNSLPTLTIPDLPKKRVKSKHLMPIVTLAFNETKKLTDSAKLVTKEIAPLTSSKTSSDLYEKIWQASYLMDALIEPIKPADVLRNALMIEEGLKDIAKKRNVEIAFPQLQSFVDKRPVDVTIQLYKLLYKIAKLEIKVKIKPLLVPAFPEGKVLPEDAFDATGNVIADLTRIAVKLKIAPVKSMNAVVGKVTPTDVYAQVVRLNQGIEFLLK
jgi:hypothetical protein